MEKDKVSLLAIGGSAGSLDVVLQLLSQLRDGFSIPIVIILHRKAAADNLLVDLLAGKTFLKVKEAEEKEAVQDGHIYVAPSDYHLLMEMDRTFSLDYSEKVHYSRPSIDISFESFSKVFGSGLAGIILSGASVDGTYGINVIKEYGGITIAQATHEAIVSFMPQNAIMSGQVDHVFTLQELIEFVNGL